jgi:hypothetical protein
VAPLPQSNTERWWAVYVNNGTTHRLGIRTADGVINTQASTVFSTLFANLAPIMTATLITGLERALKGSNVRLPFVYTGAQPAGTGTNIDNDQRARAISFTGRSNDGRKSKLFVFGMDAFSEGDYRVDISESAEIDAQVDHLNGANGVFLSISGLQPVWHAYANVGYNDHWIKEYRKG